LPGKIIKQISHCVARPCFARGGKIARHSVRNDSFCCAASGLVSKVGLKTKAARPPKRTGRLMMPALETTE
jgi:hypothetical protein